MINQLPRDGAFAYRIATTARPRPSKKQATVSEMKRFFGRGDVS